MNETVLFIGDMNANSQALARRFIDLGYKCEIIPFYEDYVGSTHFKYTTIIDGLVTHNDIIIYNGYPSLIYHSLYGFILQPIIAILYYLKNRPGPTSKRRLKKLLLRENQITIGTGFSPALLSFLGKALNIYYPSSQGVEFIGSLEGKRNSNKNIFSRNLWKVTKSNMRRALKEVSLVVNSDTGLTHDVLMELKPKKYHLDVIPFVDPIKKMNISNPIMKPTKLLMFSRLHWLKPRELQENVWALESKNNDMFIRAFAKFNNGYKGLDELNLTIVEYGKDVSETRNLVKKLGIQDSVKFHPIVPKQEIISFISNYDILAGEFLNHHVTIGGTGVEALLLLKPFINGGCPYQKKGRILNTQPPVYYANSQSEIINHLYQLICENVDPLRKERLEFARTLENNTILKTWIQMLDE